MRRKGVSGSSILERIEGNEGGKADVNGGIVKAI